MVVFQVEAISKLMVNERVGDCFAKIARNNNKKGANAIRPNRLIIFRENS